MNKDYWNTKDKEILINTFSFLKEYGFVFDFLTHDINGDIYTIAVIHNENGCFVVRLFLKYCEPIRFYKLENLNELDDIFCEGSIKEINVYNDNVAMWKKMSRKFKGLYYDRILYVVADTIKKQIKETSSFYGISVN